MRTNCKHNISLLLNCVFQVNSSQLLNVCYTIHKIAMHAFCSFKLIPLIPISLGLVKMGLGQNPDTIELRKVPFELNCRNRHKANHQGWLADQWNVASCTLLMLTCYLKLLFKRIKVQPGPLADLFVPTHGLGNNFSGLLGHSHDLGNNFLG